jgi:predicted transcriptional regulator
MLLNEIVSALNLQALCGESGFTQPVTCAYISDILSDVMSKGRKGCLWITNQTHENVLAIVFFKGLAGVILPDGITPDEKVLAKAKEKGIPLLATELPAFDIAGQLYALGIRGKV